MDVDREKELEARLADLKGRWPAHSVPPSMWQELEELEEELDKIRGKLTIDDYGGTAYGSYVQYSYVEDTTNEQAVKSWYPNAVATDDPDIWLVGTTYYTVHGKQLTP